MSDLYAVVDMSMKKVKKIDPLLSKPPSQDVYAATVHKKKIYDEGETSFAKDKENIYNTVPSVDAEQFSTDVQAANESKNKYANEIPSCKPPPWMLYGFLALFAFNMAMVVALAVAFSMIAGYRSEILSVKESLNYKCQNFYTNNIQFLDKSEKSLLKLSQDTTTEIKEIKKTMFATSLELNNLKNLSNIFLNQLITIRENLNVKLCDNFLNVSITLKEWEKEMIRIVNSTDKNCQVTASNSASIIANGIKSLHVFKSCDAIKALDPPKTTIL